MDGIYFFSFFSYMLSHQSYATSQSFFLQPEPKQRRILDFIQSNRVHVGI